MTDTDIERVFRQDCMFSKEDLLQVLEFQNAYILDDPDTGYTEALKKNKADLLEKFYAKIAKSILPELTELYWHYKYDYTGTGMELRLCSSEDIELSDDGEHIGSMTDKYEQVLLRADSDYVSPEEFAQIQEVSIATVNRWLKRGKLRYAKYTDGRWLIPSTAEKPKQDTFAQYTLNGVDAEMVEVCPILAACESVMIYIDGKNSYCDFDNYTSGLHERMAMSRAEIDKLEYVLIKSGKVIPEPPDQLMFAPDREEQQ